MLTQDIEVVKLLIKDLRREAGEDGIFANAAYIQALTPLIAVAERIDKEKILKIIENAPLDKNHRYEWTIENIAEGFSHPQELLAQAITDYLEGEEK